MKLELVIFGITGFLLYNAYYDGKYTKILLSYKKYYQRNFTLCRNQSILIGCFKSCYHLFHQQLLDHWCLGRNMFDVNVNIKATAMLLLSFYPFNENAYYLYK